jgi:hypothetical protein
MNSSMMNNQTVTGVGLSGVTSAFGNMNVGGGMPVQQATASIDDDFGDFAAANVSTPAVAKTMNSSDPMSKLINLDGLSKNPSKNKPTNMNQPISNQTGGQFQQNMPQGMQPPGMPQGIQQPGVVSAGGSDAISSMMGPGAQPPVQQGIAQQQLGANPGMGMNPQMQQQQFMMNQGMQGGNMMGGIPQQTQQGGMMYGNQMGMQGGMNAMGMQGGMQGHGMNQMGMQGVGMNQMGMQGVGMNQMGMPGQSMNMGMNNMNMGMQGGMGGQQWR